jgi:gliding motility-associated transport system ATP-binding protein
MIEVHNLVKWYGPTLAVDGVSFEIPKGKVVGFLGPNGAGKSTTLRITAGYMPPTSGRAAIDGHDVIRESEAARAKLGYMPENNPLYGEMRVEEFLHFRGSLYGMDRTARVQRIKTVCDRCGLAHLRRRVIGRLSKGNRQRVGLAQALLHNPKVLILDEPTSGLDPIQIVEIRHFLEELRDDHAIILSSHILSEIERVADRIMIIRQGRLVAEGTVDELSAKARGGHRIEIELKANPIIIKEQLTKVAGVREVETSSHDGWCRAVVTPTDGKDVRDGLMQTIQTQHWPLRNFGRRGATLEDYYRQVFSEMDQNQD